MGLILCPDCKRQISDRATHCIHCGCPIDHETIEQYENHCLIDGILYDFTPIMDRIFSPSPLEQDSITILKSKMSRIVQGKMGTKQFNDLLQYMIYTKCVPNTWESGYIEPKLQQNLLPKCPHCGSTNISKISTTSRIVSTSIFGLASSKIGKTMQCKKCGYKW